MASGTVYRLTTPAGASSWVVHATWREGSRRRQLKRSFRTKREAQGELTRFLGAHQADSFDAPKPHYARRLRRAVARRSRQPKPQAIDAAGLPPGARHPRAAQARDVLLQELRAAAGLVTRNAARLASAPP